MTRAPATEPDLDDLRREIAAGFDRIHAATRAPARLADALRYALEGGGKRLRPCLTLAVAEHLAPETGHTPAAARAVALPGACAVEMVHSYSLVHDDLPAMDNDALRRGRPTTHIAYGEALAILAGDGLLTDAFTVLAGSPSVAAAPGDPEASAARRLDAVAVLARAAGSAGMVGGQAIDLGASLPAASVSESFDESLLEDMHLRKTGALIRAAATLGAVLTGARPAAIAAMDDYAHQLGLAFQIIDDVLDVEGSATTLGKTAGKDAVAGKLTFPAVYGLEGSRTRAAHAIDRALAALDHVGPGPGRLRDLATWTLTRRR